MNHTLTTTLDFWIYSFLDQEAKKTKQTKKSIIEDALKMYQKYKLKEQILSWLDSRYEEYKNLNNEFKDIQFTSIKD